MAKYKTISNTDGFAFIFTKNHPQNCKTVQKNIPEERPRPPEIFLSRRKKRKLYDRQNRHNMAKKEL